MKRAKNGVMSSRHAICYILAGLLTFLSWVVVFVYWDKLPDIIPVHFGFNGQADAWAEKTWFYVLFLPVIQTIVLGLFLLLYYKPQFTNIPSTMWLATLSKDHREVAYGMLRDMNTGICCWTSMIFTYVTSSMNTAALNEEMVASVPLLIALISGMIIWIVYWAITIYRCVKKITKKG